MYLKQAKKEKMTCGFAELSEAMRRQSRRADVREHIYKVQSISLKKQQPKQRLTLNFFEKAVQFFSGKSHQSDLAKVGWLFLSSR